MQRPNLNKAIAQLYQQLGQDLADNGKAKKVHALLGHALALRSGMRAYSRVPIVEKKLVPTNRTQGWTHDEIEKLSATYSIKALARCTGMSRNRVRRMLRCPAGKLYRKNY